MNLADLKQPTLYVLTGGVLAYALLFWVHMIPDLLGIDSTVWLLDTVIGVFLIIGFGLMFGAYLALLCMIIIGLYGFGEWAYRMIAKILEVA